MKKTAVYITCIFVFILAIVSCSPKPTASIAATEVKKEETNNLALKPDTEFYTVVEKQASFQNADVELFKKYLQKSIKYPASAVKAKAQGTVMVQFGVDCYGTIKFADVVKSSKYKALDNEAIRVVKSSPKWIPARIGGRDAGQIFTIPVVFKLKKK